MTVRWMGVKPARRQRSVVRLLPCIVLGVGALALGCEVGMVLARSTASWVRGECCDFVRHPTRVDQFQFQCGKDRRPLDTYETVVPSIACLGFRAVSA